MTVINTNTKALVAQASLSNVNKLQATTMERLSTGLRINSAADDAAGLAITNRMTSQVRGYAVAIRNSNDGISMAQTAEGAMGQITDMLQRVRELAVQASNGSMTQSDRTSLQDEVSQLKTQIQDIAVKTNHNNINLLDGSAGKITLQTGVNAGDTMVMGFDSMQIKDIGLGSRASLSSVGGKIVTGGANDALVDGDLTLNGVVVGASLAKSDNVSYVDPTTPNNAASAIAKAAAINAVSDKSGVFATVDKTEVNGQNMTAAAAGTSSALTINGVSTGTFYLSGNTETDRATVEKAINAISDRTGVVATNTHDDKQGMNLVAKDGRNIDITTDTSGGANSANLGVANDGTYVGTYDLSTKDGSSITVGSTVAQSQAGQGHSGLTFGTYDANKAQMSTIARSTVTAAPTSGNAGILAGNTLVINGVGIGAANGDDDKASAVDATNAPGSVKADSAIAIAAAINKSADKTGVTATAQANVISGTGFTAGDVGTIYLNGVTISANLGSHSTRDDVLNVINKYQGETGVVATAYGAGVQLTAADGRNISIGATKAIGGTAAAGDALGLVGVSLTTAAAATTYYSSVKLSSDKSFTVDSGSEGDVASFQALGFRQGTFGGSDNGVKVADIDISTVTGATNAIEAADAAIQTVGENQAKAGAYQNRLDHIVSNLTESNQNISASRSRIQDADYGTETTNLAKAQIVQQAATAMLAQANQSAQTVLSLLK